MNEQLESNIIKLFNEGNAQAFEEIFNHFYKPLCYFAERLTGNSTEAEDIVIETFTKLFQRFPNFESYINIRTFLYVTARNASFNLLKSSKRQSEKRKDYLHLLDKEEYMDIEQVQAELIKIIHNAIEQLPGQCRVIFKMIFFEGKHTSEIASQLGLNESTVRSQKRMAIKKLRIMLSEN